MPRTTNAGVTGFTRRPYFVAGSRQLIVSGRQSADGVLTFCLGRGARKHIA